MEKVSKIQIGCEKYDIQDKEARELIDSLRDNILNDIEVNATVDDTTSDNPSVAVEKSGNNLTFKFSGIKGKTGRDGLNGENGQNGRDGRDGAPGNNGVNGAPGQTGAPGVDGVTPHIHAEAYVANTTGTPGCSVTRSGSDTEPYFSFYFTGLKGEKGDPGKDGSSTGTGTTTVVEYNDTAIWNKITEIETDISNKWNQIDGKVTDDVNRIVNNSEWLDTLREGIQSDSNFGEDDVDQYLQNIGLYTKTNGTRIWAWSSIQQDVNGLTLTVDNLRRAIETGTDPDDLETLESALKIYIDEKTNTAFSNLHTEYARKDAETVIEWMYSELTQGANSEETWNEIVSAAKGQGGSGAISNVKTNIKKLADGDYLATANLVSAITSKKTDIANVLMDPAVLSSAGVLTTADLNNASSTLYSKLGQKYAAIDTAVTKDSDGKIQSGVTIAADQINLNGQTWADFIGLSTAINNTIKQLTSNTVTLDPNGVTVSGSISNGGAGNVVIGRNSIRLYSVDSTGTISTTSNIYSDGFSFPYLSYSSSNATLNASTVNINNNLTVGGTISTTKLQDTTTGSAYITLSGNSGGAISLNAAAVVCNGNQVTSDESLKNIIGDINTSVESIAASRIVDYEFKSNVGNTHSGAIAQDWQTILPNTVKVIDELQHLGLDYSSAALVSAVIDAREIVKLKQENAELKERLAAIEARLAEL